jgi:hypothetical protein
MTGLRRQYATLGSAVFAAAMAGACGARSDLTPPPPDVAVNPEVFVGTFHGTTHVHVLSDPAGLLQEDSDQEETWQVSIVGSGDLAVRFIASNLPGPYDELAPDGGDNGPCIERFRVAETKGRLS